MSDADKKPAGGDNKAGAKQDSKPEVKKDEKPAAKPAGDDSANAGGADPAKPTEPVQPTQAAQPGVIESKHSGDLLLHTGVNLPAGGKVKVDDLRLYEGHAVCKAWVKAGVIECHADEEGGY